MDSTVARLRQVDRFFGGGHSHTVESDARRVERVSAGARVTAAVLVAGTRAAPGQRRPGTTRAPGSALGDIA